MTIFSSGPGERLHDLLSRCNENGVDVSRQLSRDVRTHLNGVMCILVILESNENHFSNDSMSLCMAAKMSAAELLNDIELFILYSQWIDFQNNNGKVIN
jgi:hypothetical protein